jgi:hypothetical protein
VARERALAEKFMHHAHEPVEAFSHVRRSYAKENANGGGELRAHPLAP